MKINTKMFSALNYRSIILGTVIFASVLAFLFTGFGRFQVFNFKKMDPNTALIVGNQKVDLVEFSNILRAQGFSNSMPENQKKYLAYQVLNQLIDQKLIYEVAQNMGFVAEQASIAAFIRSIPAFTDPKTGKFSYEIVKQYLSSQDINELDFFKNIKNELSVQNVSELIFMANPYPDALVKTQYEIENTVFNLQYAKLTINSARLKQEASAKVDEFLKNPDNQPVLEAVFNDKKMLMNHEAQYKAQSILISYKGALRAQGEASTRSKELAREKIDNILSKIQNGESFSKASSQINDDTRAKNNDGSLGFVDSSSIDSTSYDALSKLTLEKPLSGVIETPYGFRIFKLEEKHDAVTKTFDDVKSEIAEDIILQKLKQTAQVDLENKLRTAFIGSKNNVEVDKVLAEYNIQWKKFENQYSINENSVQEFGNSDELAENVFYLKKPGDVIPKVLKLDNDTSVIIKLVSLRKPDAPSTAELESLRTKISDEQSRALFQSLLKELRESYERKGKIKMNPELIS